MGYVYLLECSDNDSTFYKIGFTKNSIISKRIKNLQTGNKDEIRELYKYKTLYDRKLEIAIHNYFTHNRCKKGEWFQIELKDVVNFINICEKFEKGFDALKDNTYFNKKLF